MIDLFDDPDYKFKLKTILKMNVCTNIFDVFSEFAHDSDIIYKKIIMHLYDLQYISVELCDENEINNIANMSIDDGLKYLTPIYKEYAVDIDDYTNVIITYALCIAWSNGYPLARFHPNQICHCQIYTNECNSDVINPFTRTMQTLFTIHALIYDKQDVKQWWNDLSEHCKNTFKTELQKILNNDYQHEYLATTKYFDQFMSIYTSL